MYSIGSTNKSGKIPHKFTGLIFDGIVCSLSLQSIITGFAGNLHDLTKLNLKGILTRGGKKIEVFNTNLKDLLTLSHLTAPLYEYVMNPGMITPLSNPFVLPYRAIVPLRFFLGGSIDTTDGSYFEIEYQLNDGFFGASVDTANSSIELDVIETETPEYFTPITNVKIIEQGQRTFRDSLGDNVTEIVIANYDKTSILETDQVIQDIELVSKTYKRSDNFRELLTKSINHYSDTADALIRKQNFLVYKSHRDLDEVVLSIRLNAANVTPGNNVVLWRSFITSNEHVTRASMKDHKRDLAAMKKGTFDEAIASKIAA